jgi:ribosomal protein S18 acetylase RimI-like enzyme
MTATTRRSTSADLPVLVRIWRRSVEATHDFLSPEDVDRYERVVLDALPALEVTVAERDGRVVGFAATDGARVEMLFVDPSAHRGGIGAMLLADATAGRTAVELDVNEQNPGARRFYARLGFREVGRSALDGEGRPFPLLHLRRDGAAAQPPPTRRSTKR